MTASADAGMLAAGDAASTSRDLGQPSESDAGSADKLREDAASAVADATALPVAPAVAAAAHPPATAQDGLHESAAASSFDPYRYVGLSVDIGNSGPLPDAGLLLIGRPLNWAYLHGGVTTNLLALGLRGGLTLVNPFFVPLSLTCEVGHFYEGDANTAKRWFTNDAPDIAALHDFSYDYVNLLGGLAFQSRHIVVFIRAGTTWMRANVHNFERTVYDASKIEIQSTDPKLSYRGPSLRMGLLFFL